MPMSGRRSPEKSLSVFVHQGDEVKAGQIIAALAEP